MENKLPSTEIINKTEVSGLVKQLNRILRKDRRSRKKIIGEVRYHYKFRSNLLDNERTIIVWLPPSYGRESSVHYPVLYMHDGQNIMDPKTSFAGADWRVDETATFLIKSGKMQEIIIVGIYNNEQRLEEYSDSEKGNNYLHFIIDGLKPFIDKEYLTLADRKNTALMGSSMGGLISFLGVWRHNDVFSKAACLSNSFFYDEDKAIKMVKEDTGEKKNIRIYLDHGEDGLDKGQIMFCALTAKGYVLGQDIDYYYAPGAEHSESAWAERLERPLLFLFGK